MIPTQDPDYTATRLLRLAAKAKKPVRIFLGVNAKGGKDRLLVAVDDASNISKYAPREELMVAPGANPSTLAAALAAIWARLGPLIPNVPRSPRQGPGMQFMRRRA